MSIKVPNKFRLGLNTGFAVNRYSEPEEWVRIIGDELGVEITQFTADMLNVDLSKKIIYKQVDRIQKACETYKVTIPCTFTGGFTRVNHLAHPDPDIRRHWIEWFKRFVDLSIDLGSSSMGSHFGIFRLKGSFLCILMVSIFLIICGIAFGAPPARMSKVLEVIPGPCWGHFVSFFADAAKLGK